MIDPERSEAAQDEAAWNELGRVRAMEDLPVAVIGAGPVGLAAAAHLLGRGIVPVVLERSSRVGAAVRAWGHVPMFSNWAFNLDQAASALLERHGWTAPDGDGFPTGAELAERYLEPLAALPEMAPCIQLDSRVTGIGRMGLGKRTTGGRHLLPFEIRVTGPDQVERRILARAVIDASGTWLTPSPAGSSGLPATGERAAADRIRYGMPDLLGSERGRYAGRRVMVLGGGDSALGNLLALARIQEAQPATEIVWAVRRAALQRSFGGGSADQLPQRGALGTQARALVEAGRVKVLAPFALEEIQLLPDGRLRVSGAGADGQAVQDIDELVVATGLRPQLDFLRELRLDLDPALECPRILAPMIDPNLHSCGSVPPHGVVELTQPEAGFFIIGMKSYGRAPTFLLATGHEQARSVAAHLAGDEEAARRVELVLPETGVCSGPANVEAATCCGGPVPVQGDACCVLDAAVKDAGLEGCGCGGPSPATTAVPASTPAAVALSSCCR